MAAKFGVNMSSQEAKRYKLAFCGAAKNVCLVINHNLELKEVRHGC